MTDSTGLIQHAIYSIPRRESGYTVDDNARALRLCARLWSQTPTRRMLKRVTIYLSLIQHARRPGGGFHNLMNYQRQWLDVDATGDCQGQAVRALAEVLGSTLPDGFKTLALELIEMALPTLAETRSLRAQAYVILAYGHLHDAGVRNLKGLEAIAWSASHHLAECYQRSKRTDWEWFEAQMTYANAVLPHALFVAAKRWPAEGFLEIATRTFDFLGTHTIRGAIFRPVGNNGWFAREERMAEYDQQPLEAATMADAALTAFTVTELECHLKTLQLSLIHI